LGEDELGHGRHKEGIVKNSHRDEGAASREASNLAFARHAARVRLLKRVLDCLQRRATNIRAQLVQDLAELPVEDKNSTRLHARQKRFEEVWGSGWIDGEPMPLNPLGLQDLSTLEQSLHVLEAELKKL
jgi:hypothetical protein